MRRTSSTTPLGGLWATVASLLFVTGLALGDAQSLEQPGPFVGVMLGTPTIVNAVIGYDLTWTTIRLSGAYFGGLNGIQADIAPLRTHVRGLALCGFVVGGYVDYDKRSNYPEAVRHRDRTSYFGVVGELSWRGFSFAPGLAASSNGDTAPLVQLGYTAGLGGP